MSISETTPGCISIDQMSSLAKGKLPEHEATGLATHLWGCPDCQHAFDAIRALSGSMPAWPIDMFQPPASVWGRLGGRIAAESGSPALPALENRHIEEWDEVAPGILCRPLSLDESTQRVSLLVRLQPGVDYPPHSHAEVEELHLLEGELWIDDRKLVAGDYNRADAGSADRRVWSDTGCTCLLITSLQDRLLNIPAR